MQHNYVNESCYLHVNIITLHANIIIAYVKIVILDIKLCYMVWEVRRMLNMII